MNKRVILIGGGVRTGKSALALARAQELGTRRVFIATAQAFDPEMHARIDAHKAERGAAFTTLEAPFALTEALEQAAREGDVVVVDCLTFWISNLLMRGDSQSHVLEEVEHFACALERRALHAIVVTNEVGMGVVPESALGRAFRDVMGRAHQRLAACADEVFFSALGLMLRLKPEPLAVHATKQEKP
jgi:adenosylcobinamide kinase/adenosylcobinamide-phosphate guanylyltransferase